MSNEKNIMKYCVVSILGIFGLFVIFKRYLRAKQDETTTHDLSKIMVNFLNYNLLLIFLINLDYCRRI